ncbi:MAG: SPFH domain-containing protein [Clostridia bacterium]|nr:SPFH domain-containing protein [Clostridia bacterium]
MGLIKAAAGAIGSTFKDQWKEAIRCEDMGNDILMMKKTTSTGVISNKSTIIVGPGQCAIIYDNGRVIDATAEEGFYTFDDSSTPSFFAGQFGAVFKEMWQRFTYNGKSAKQQAVFFFNVKEIVDNKFGTKTPIPYQDWLHSMTNEMNGKLTPLSINIRCYGQYSFKMTNPALFMNEIAGTADIFYKKELIEGQMRSEVVGVLQNVLNELGNSINQISPLELPSQTDEMKQMMDEKVFDEPIRARGISIKSFIIESVTPDEASQQKINDYELSANASMRKGKLTSDYGEAVKAAASNSSGSMNGFMGIGMMNMASGGVMGGVAQGVWQDTTPPVQQPANNQVQPQQPVNNSSEVNSQSSAETSNSNEWECLNCHSKANGKFCPECGTKKPENTKKFCSNCGKEIREGAKFCSECGTKVE